MFKKLNLTNRLNKRLKFRKNFKFKTKLFYFNFIKINNNFRVQKLNLNIKKKKTWLNVII